jgi:predicted PurR-regulated permease PerM
MKKDRTSPLFFLVAVLASIAAMYVAKAILLPIALAILLTFLLTPLADRLERWYVPRVVAVLAVVLFSFALFGGLGWIVTKQVIALSSDLDKHKRTLIAKIERLKPDSPGWRRFTDALSDVRAALVAGEKNRVQPTTTNPTGTPANKSAIPSPDDAKQRAAERREADETLTDLAETGQFPQQPPGDNTVAVNVVALPPSPLTQVQDWLGPLVAPLTTGGMVVVLVLFLLLDRENQRSRLLQLFGRSHMHATAAAMHDVAYRVGRYLRMLFLLNAGYGIAVGICLWFIGVPLAAMWGMLGFSLRFLPYIGPWIAASLPIMVSIATSPGWTQPAIVLGAYLTIELISNNVIEPLVYGTTTGVSTVGVMISAIFWTWLWGPIGLILSMPMTVCLLVAARYIPQLKFISILLADQSTLSPAERVYQRLLAFDDREPLKLAHKELKDAPLIDYYDHVLLPALVMAEQDRYADRLNEEQSTFVMEASHELIDQLGEAAGKKLADSRAEAEAQAPDANSTVTAPSAKVLTIPLRDEGDEIAARMLTQLLVADGFHAETGTTTSLTSELVDSVAESEADIVVISVLPPIAPRDSRLLWKKLRSRYPTMPIVVAFWTAEKDKDALAEPVADAASRVVTTLSEASLVIRALGAQTSVAKTA